MSLSFDHIKWKSTPVVEAVFSLKNAHYNAEAPIPGLNLGYNTTEPDELTRHNRRLWLESAGADVKLTSWGLQVHGNRVQTVTEPDVYPDTDALVTNRPGYSLGIFVADCAAVLLVDEAHHVIGAAHAGWKGAAANILPKTIAAMQQLGAETSAMKAFVSPCISKEYFEVGEEVAARFPEQFIDRSGTKPHVDLKAFLKQQLLDAGLPQASVSVSGGCTVGDADNHYSFRREKTNSGRMMAVITLKAV